MSDVSRIGGSAGISRIRVEGEFISDIKQIIEKRSSEAHKVSISEVSQILNKLSASTDKADQKRIEEAKKLIQSGKYTSKEKIKQAIENALPEILGF